ncbi:MAG: spore coat protein [Bacilli bacterium]|nr:spore coat protein [Bacilli bacterium]MBP3635550.1 spore coat protein [Bacilli bacterium]
MNNVPNIISTKDLSYISDMFEWNFTAAKKALHYSNEVTSEEIKNELENIYEMHKNISSNLLNLLNEGGK